MDRLKILVIEGDQKYAAIMAGSLEQAGFTVFTAASGDEGVALASSLGPALVLLNLATPGTNGLEICKAIHGRSPELPILLLTQKEAAFNPVYTANYGIVEFLKKPFSGNALVETVRGILKVGEPAAVVVEPEEEAEEAMPMPEAAEGGEAEEASVAEAEPVDVEQAEVEEVEVEEAAVEEAAVGGEAEQALEPYAAFEPEPVGVGPGAEDVFEARPIELPEGDLFEKSEPAIEPDDLGWMDEEGGKARLGGPLEPEIKASHEKEPEIEKPIETAKVKEAEVAAFVPATAPEVAGDAPLDDSEPEEREAVSAHEEEAAQVKRPWLGKKIYIPALLVPLLVVLGFAAIYVFNLSGSREAEQLRPAEVVEEEIAPEKAETAALEEKAEAPSPPVDVKAPDKPDAPKPTVEKPAKAQLPGVSPTGAEGDRLKAAPKAAPATPQQQARPQPPAKAAPTTAGGKAEAPVSGHFVQFGYFGAEENASRLAKKLKGMGLMVRVADEKGQAKTSYRVVLDEAFTSEDAAKQRAAEIIVTHGVDAIALSRVN